MAQDDRVRISIPKDLSARAGIAAAIAGESRSAYVLRILREATVRDLRQHDAAMAAVSDVEAT